MNREGNTTVKRDCNGATIRYEGYTTTTMDGWEVDHIIPVSKGGSDDLENLQALHWENNKNKGENYPNWTPVGNKQEPGNK